MQRKVRALISYLSRLPKITHTYSSYGDKEKIIISWENNIFSLVDFDDFTTKTKTKFHKNNNSKIYCCTVVGSNPGLPIIEDNAQPCTSMLDLHGK